MDPITHAVSLIQKAKGLVITAGAGLGVDSGLPDFRGPGGFWRAYPALGKARMHFEDIANPQAFVDSPRLAWGFYGHRFNMYRDTRPGPAFNGLLKLAADKELGAFIFTSNVDGHFQKAGFPADRVCEVHGSINHLQCLNNCCQRIWHAGDLQLDVDAENCLLTSKIPTCPRCGGIARPNILMFGDWGWQSSRQEMQTAALHAWLDAADDYVCIELGAGTGIPTVRRFGERLPCPLIRINLWESEVPRSTDVSIELTASEAIQSIVDNI